MGPFNRDKEGICAKKEEGVSIVKGRKRAGERVYSRTNEEEIYQTVKVTPDSAGILCRKKRWKEKMCWRI